MHEILKCGHLFFYAKTTEVEARILHHYGIELVTKPQEPGDIYVAFDTMEDTGFLLEASL